MVFGESSDGEAITVEGEVGVGRPLLQAQITQLSEAFWRNFQ